MANNSGTAEADSHRNRDELQVLAVGEHVVETTLSEEPDTARLDVEAGTDVDAELRLGVQTPGELPWAWRCRRPPPPIR